MKNKSKKVISLLSILLIICFLLPSVAMTAEAHTSARNRILRVACPLQAGLFEEDENGNYSGYSYEYLMKMAQRAAWKLEFRTYEPTNENLQAALDGLQKGEMDLMGGMVYSDELAEIYDFTSVPYGASYYVLMADETNQDINERTYDTMPNLRVAMNQRAKESNSLFDSFCKEKGISYQAVYATGTNLKEDMVKNGQADVYISKDIIKNDGYKTVVRFASQPFYFATTKGNTDLMEELNQVIMEINGADPYYEQKLHEKYFKYESDYQLSLTADELDYVKNVPSVRMIILTGRVPLEDYDPKTGEYSGIIVDIIKKMSAKSGLPVEFIPADNLEQAKQLLQEGKADIFAGFPSNYSAAEEFNVLLTSPIFTMPVVRINNINGKAKNEGILVSNSINLFEGQKNIRYIDETSQIFDLVSRGEYKEAYLNGYLAQHYMEQKNFSNISLTQTPFSNYELCLGVNRNADLHLISVLEQMISKIKAENIEDIVYKNTVHTYSMSFVDMIKRNPIEFLLLLLTVFIVIVALLLILTLRTKRLNKLISQEKSKYQEISTLDQLAQIYNNDTFKQMSKEYLSQTDMVPTGTLIICDIDNFKAINDTYGHLLGDEVIGALGELLKTLFQKDTLVARFGGDEFVVLMKGIIDQDFIAGCCTELLTGCRTVVDKCEITFSLGGAVFIGNVPFDELFQAADEALYRVKNRGKNGFEILPEPIVA